MTHAKTTESTFRPRCTWLDGKAGLAVMLAAYLVVASLPAILAIALGTITGKWLRQLGLITGLLGFSLMVLQVVLAGRFISIDRPFGLDRVMRFHRTMGIAAFVLILVHPLLLSLSLDSWYYITDAPQWEIDVGKVAIALLVLGVPAAMLRRFLPVDYQAWRVTHKIMIVVIVLAFIHSYWLGHSFLNPVMAAIWWIMVSLAVGIFLWRNTVVPFVRRRYRVVDVRPTSHDTWTLEMEPVEGEPPRRNPGQFMFLRLIRQAGRDEEHPFTISNSPTEPGRLQATIKESGNFTDTIGETQVGDTARIEAPFGRFSWVHHEAEAVLFIAGGVGITPIRAMLRCLADTGDTRPTAVIYGNKTRQDILFRDELDSLGENVEVTHILSQPDEDWDGPQGFITAEILRKHAGELLDRADVFLCGPPGMMKAVRRALRDCGVPRSRVHYEYFSL
jgi:predicted ferric reductase